MHEKGTRVNHIPNDEHVFITGKTGSGKSFLAEVYLAGFEYVAKLDTKGEVFERRKSGKEIWYGLKENVDFTVIEHLAEIDRVETKKVIYAPSPEEQTEEFYDSFMEWIYKRENTTCWIDELMQVAPSPLKYPFGLRTLETRGRSKNCSVWACTQRPAMIPSDVVANSTHFFVFDLNILADRKKLVDTTGAPEFFEKPGYRNFWYMKDSDEYPILATLRL